MSLGQTTFPSLPDRWDLAAIFTPPRSLQEPLARRRLLWSCDAAANPPITLITAHAGYGKTSLLSQHYQNSRDQGCRVAWLSIEGASGDDLIVRLIQSLEWSMEDNRAIEPIDATSARSRLIKVVSRYTSGVSSSWIYIDDLHDAVDLQARDLLRWLIDHIPPQLRIAVASRNAVRLFSPDLLVRGSVQIIDAGKLRFTQSEGKSFLADAVTPVEAEKLIRMAEGWPGGLQLLKLAVRNETEPSDEWNVSPISEELIWDYMSEQVLSRLSPRERTFLLKTSVCERFDVELAMAISSEADTEDLIERLYKTNFFITRVGERGKQYRYHRMLAETLKRELNARDKHWVADLHRAAARNLMERHRWTRGLAHARASDDLSFLAHCVEQAQGWRLAFSAGSSVWHALKDIDDKALRAYPILLLCKAYSFLHRGRIEMAREYYALLCSDAENGNAIEPWANDLEVFGYLLKIYEGRALRESERNRVESLLNARTGDTELPLQAMLAELLAWESRFSWQLTRAIDFGWHSERLCREAGVGLIRSYALLSVGSAQAALGNLNRASYHFVAAAQHAAEMFGEDSDQFLAAQVYAAYIELERGNFEAPDADDPVAALWERVGEADLWAELAYLVLKILAWRAFQNGGYLSAQRFLDEAHERTAELSVVRTFGATGGLD